MILDTPVPLAGYEVDIETDKLLKAVASGLETDVFRSDSPRVGRLVATKLGTGTPWVGKVHLATLELETGENAQIALNQANLVTVDEELIAARIEPFSMHGQLPLQTQLLANYPNPFNPETSIPYQLAEEANVVITIYEVNGALVRRLSLGHQAAGYYTDKQRAAYWDGKDEAGELVSSGVYFYQLRAGSFSAVKRMVILK